MENKKEEEVKPQNKNNEAAEPQEKNDKTPKKGGVAKFIIPVVAFAAGMALKAALGNRAAKKAAANE